MIIKVPAISGLGKTKGCEKAPNEILKTLKEIWTNEEGKEINLKNLDLEEIHVDNSNLKLSQKLIEKNAKKIFIEQEKAIFLGGDHSITYSLVKVFDSCFENSGLVVFDAHADLMPAEKEPTHEDWLRLLIEKGFNSKNIILIGLRNPEISELNFLKNKKIKFYTSKELFRNLQIIEGIMEVTSKFNKIYLSIDIDVIDPAFAPGVAFKEPGGLTSRELLFLIQKLKILKNLKAVDITEINPLLDEKNLTIKLGAKILSEFL